MPDPATFDSFQAELGRLVDLFKKNLTHFKNPGYDEASLRQEFLNPLFRALGWDVENEAGRIPTQRECEVESRTHIGGRQKRADYLFRTDGRDRFVCEAKKPAEELHNRYAFQAKRYGWNKNLVLALLTDFEQLKIYVVGGRPHIDQPDVGLWKTLHFTKFAENAQEFWNLLARERVAGGSIEQLIESLPKKVTAARGKAKQQWLIKPDRNRALDTDFLNFLDEARKELGSDLINQNDREDLLRDNRLNEAVQRILDRILFLRICEDRDIDTGGRLDSIVQTWRKNYESEAGLRAKQQSFLRDEPPAHYGGHGIRAPKESLWHAVVRHFRALDRRPPSHVPFFNGNLFKPHFSEELIIGDEWLARFIGELSDDESPYLFNVIPVEILGTIYERFLGKVVRPHGRGVTIEEKPEVRKAGGVYYTPRYIVNYIVEQTVGKLVNDIAGEAEVGRAVPSAPPDGVNAPSGAVRTPRPTIKDFAKRSHALRILDPACGSGSFLIRAFERVCEHWQQRLTDSPDDRNKKLCWVDAETKDVHLTVDLKRRILLGNIYGVDLDPGAVEVTQLSLYLKMLENENRTTLQRERELFADEEQGPLLPPLENNIKCGNSLIASDFSIMSDDLVRVRAFDWNVGFKDIMRGGGFDAVIGNPPYIRIQRVDHAESDYLFRVYKSPTSKMDLSLVFVEKALLLVNKDGRSAFICTSQWLTTDYGRKLREMLRDGRLHTIVDFGSLPVFEGANTYPAIFVLSRTPAKEILLKKVLNASALNEAGIKSAPTATIQLSLLSDAPWSLGVFNLPQVLQRTGIPFKALSEFGGAYIGCKSGMNAAFVLSTEDANLKRIERGVLFPYALRGEEVARYEVTSPSFKIIYPYRETSSGNLELIAEPEFKKRFPNAYAHLSTFRNALRRRQDSRRLYADGPHWYRHLRPGTFRYIRKPKLVFKAIAREMSGGLLAENTAFDGANCPALLLEDLQGHDPKYVLALLNSRLLSTHLRAVCPPKLSGYVKFTANGLSGTPIRVLDWSKASDKAIHDDLVALVDKMLVLAPKLRAAPEGRERETLRNAVTATDQQIDQLVYELYGLTPEEIALVEESGK